MRLKRLSMAIALVLTCSLLVFALAPPGYTQARTAHHFTQIETPSDIVASVIVIAPEVAARSGPSEIVMVINQTAIASAQLDVTLTESNRATDKLRMPLANRAGGDIATLGLSTGFNLRE